MTNPNLTPLLMSMTPQFANAVQQMIQAEMAKKGVRFFQGIVSGFTGDKVFIRRPEDAQPRGVPSPVLDTGAAMSVGDVVWCAEMFGGVIVMGKEVAPGGELANYVDVSGDTMTGFLTLDADPVNALHAATKQYVDGRTPNLAPIRNTTNIAASMTEENTVLLWQYPSGWRKMQGRVANLGSSSIAANSNICTFTNAAGKPEVNQVFLSPKRLSNGSWTTSAGIYIDVSESDVFRLKLNAALGVGEKVDLSSVAWHGS